MVAGTQGDPKQSLEQHRQALEFARKIGRAVTSPAHSQTSATFWQIKTDLAEPRRATRTRSPWRKRSMIASDHYASHNLATVSETLGKFPVALHLYQQSLEEARMVLDKRQWG